MKTTLWATLSADGFLARSDDSTPWSDADWDAFKEFVTSQDACLIGRRTYEIMKADDAFIEGTEFIVVSNDQSLDTGNFRRIAIKSVADLPAVEKLCVIGGGKLNGSLVGLGMIDEVIIDVEPQIFGTGKRMLDDCSTEVKLELIESKLLSGGVVQNRYKLVK